MVHIGELLLYLYIIPIYGTFNAGNQIKSN